MHLVVTTGQDPPSGLVERAREVAARCGLAYVPRTDSLPRVLRRCGAEGAYVVTTPLAEIRARGQHLSAHPSTARVCLHTGRRHPLLRAVAPADGAPVRHVVDATLGQAKDALHLAAVLGCRVTGLERAPLLACLAEDGLARFAARGEAPWAEAAPRIAVEVADAETWLAERPAGSADVVYLDPMFPSPLEAGAGFDLLRALAHPAPLTPGLLAEARRVAAQRVVLKVPAGLRPADLEVDPGVWSARVQGRRLDYLVAPPV